VSWLTVTLQPDAGRRPRSSNWSISLTSRASYGIVLGPARSASGWDLALMAWRGICVGRGGRTATKRKHGRRRSGKDFMRRSSQEWGGLRSGQARLNRGQRGGGADIRVLLRRARRRARPRCTPSNVLGDPVRRRILVLLATGEHSSGEIVVVVQREFGITQSAVSQQLRILRSTAAFASVRADGAAANLAVQSAGFASRRLADKFRASCCRVSTR